MSPSLELQRGAGHSCLRGELERLSVVRVIQLVIELVAHVSLHPFERSFPLVIGAGMLQHEAELRRRDLDPLLTFMHQNVKPT